MALPEGLDLAELEVVAQGLDSDGEVIDQALEVVRDFIADRDLVLYGGLGLDYALRLRGGRIYPDEERPDYDALSPRNVADAYDLADILHEKGFPDVQAIPALHVQTMRVRVSFAVVADLSFAPGRVLDAMPTLQYAPSRSAGAIRIVHPHWQIMDQHLAFCFPFRDAPREPVFHRFSKDLVRHNLLLEKYPLPDTPAGVLDESGFVDATFAIPEAWALHGDAARRLFLALADAPQFTGPLRFPKKDLWLACTLSSAASVVAQLDEWGYSLEAEFRPFMDMLPATLRAKRQAGGEGPETITVFHFPARLLAATPLLSDKGLPVRVVGSQQLLLTDMLGHHLARKKVTCGLTRLTEDSADDAWDLESQACLARYLRLRDAVNLGAKKLEQLRPAADAPPARLKKWEAVVDFSPFSLTTQTLGTLNYGERQLLSIALDAKSAKQEPAGELRTLMPSDDELRGLPRKYTPGVVRGRMAEHPNFTLENPLFRWDGGRV